MKPSRFAIFLLLVIGLASAARLIGNTAAPSPPTITIKSTPAPETALAKAHNAPMSPAISTP